MKRKIEQCKNPGEYKRVVRGIRAGSYTSIGELATLYFNDRGHTGGILRQVIRRVVVAWLDQ